MVTAVRMVEVHNVRAVLRATRSDAVVLCLTAFATRRLRPHRRGGDRARARPPSSRCATSPAPRRSTRGVRARSSTATGRSSPPPRAHRHLPTRRRAVLRCRPAVPHRAHRGQRRDGRDPAAARLQVLDATGAQALGEIVASSRTGASPCCSRVRAPSTCASSRPVGVLDRLAHQNHLFDDLGRCPRARARARGAIRRRGHRGGDPLGAQPTSRRDRNRSSTCSSASRVGWPARRRGAR